MRNLFRSIALWILPDSDRFRFLAYKPKFEAWRKRQLGKHPVFIERTKMYDYINSSIVGNQPMLYLEFGVFEGESIKYFAAIHNNPLSKLVGFDTFEGLPEDWNEFSRSLASKTFSTGGKTPAMDDNRVSFVKGLFQDTLPAFLARMEASHQHPNTPAGHPQ